MNTPGFLWQTGIPVYVKRDHPQEGFFGFITEVTTPNELMVLLTEDLDGKALQSEHPRSFQPNELQPALERYGWCIGERVYVHPDYYQAGFGGVVTGMISAHQDTDLRIKELMVLLTQDAEGHLIQSEKSLPFEPKELMPALAEEGDHSR